MKKKRYHKKDRCIIFGCDNQHGNFFNSITFKRHDHCLGRHVPCRYREGIGERTMGG